MAWLYSKITGWLAAAGVAAAVLFAAYSRGRSDQKTARAEDRIKSTSEARKIEHEVDGLGGDDVDRRLNKWMRDAR